VSETIVHLLRHGEVHNPEGVLYGRRPGFHLSERGRAMAQRVADTIGDRDIVHLRISPLERVRETAAPLAEARGLEPVVDDRVIESENCFEGRTFSRGPLTLLDPRTWRYLYNPFRPSWGEPYKQVAARMRAAVLDARAAAEGHEAVVVSHQLPIWVTRLSAEGRPFFHDPRKRQCTLCSLTTLHFDGTRLVKVTYSEPAGDMLPRAEAAAPFSAGGAPDEKKPT
jgi:broad specificity phosphatase PhoE